MNQVSQHTNTEGNVASNDAATNHRSDTSSVNRWGALVLVALASLFPNTASAQKPAKGPAAGPAAVEKIEPKSTVELAKVRLSTGQELEYPRGEEHILKAVQDAAAAVTAQLKAYGLKPVAGIKICVLPDDVFPQRARQGLEKSSKYFDSTANAIMLRATLSDDDISMMVKSGIPGLTFAWNPRTYTAPAWSFQGAAKFIVMRTDACAQNCKTLAELPEFQNHVDGIGALSNFGGIPHVSDILRSKGGGKIQVPDSVAMSFLAVLLPQDAKSISVCQQVLSLAAADAAAQGTDAEAEPKQAEAIAGKLVTILKAADAIKKADAIKALKEVGIDTASKEWKAKFKENPNLETLNAFYRLQLVYAERAIEAARQKVAKGPDVASGGTDPAGSGEGKDVKRKTNDHK